MRYNQKRACLAAFLCFLVSSAGGQSDTAKEKAIGQMRRIADAMKRCPEEIQYQDECAVHYIGPPTNVDWDVLPSKTVRAPFQGFVEFALPQRSKDVDPSKQSRQVHQKCVDREKNIAALTAPALAEAMKQGPKWRDGHYRYEFDLGSDAPELIKMLWVVKDKDNNTITSATNSGEHYCWTNAAQEAEKSVTGEPR